MKSNFYQCMKFDLKSVLANDALRLVNLLTDRNFTYSTRVYMKLASLNDKVQLSSQSYPFWFCGNVLVKRLVRIDFSQRHVFWLSTNLNNKIPTRAVTIRVHLFVSKSIRLLWRILCRSKYSFVKRDKHLNIGIQWNC